MFEHVTIRPHVIFKDLSCLGAWQAACRVDHNGTLPRQVSHVDKVFLRRACGMPLSVCVDSQAGTSDTEHDLTDKAQLRVGSKERHAAAA